MTNQTKNEIVNLIQTEKKRLGSGNKVAVKCGVSPATISQMLAGKWELISTEMWSKVGAAVGYDTGGWQMAETTNLRIMRKVLDNALEKRHFITVAYHAGAGKTAGIKAYFLNNSRAHNYHLVCRKWGATDFLKNLMRCVGIEVPRGYRKADEMGQVVIQFFVENRHQVPLLVIDQANSLRDSALTFIIDLFNAMEDNMALVLVGTGALKKNIKRGVQYDRDGFDEIESRLGRSYQALAGATRKDVARICEANGITDKETQVRVFRDSHPIRKSVGKSSHEVVEDMRRVKRVIEAEQLKSQAR